jgi:hypothetical protein
MGEVLTAPGSRVPHHGPVTRDCPVECLLTVLSLHSFNPLTRAYDAPFDGPRTVGDVIDLCAGEQLGQIRGVGPHRVSEIEAALARLDLTGCRHQRAAQSRGTR